MPIIRAGKLVQMEYVRISGARYVGIPVGTVASPKQPSKVPKINPLQQDDVGKVEDVGLWHVKWETLSLQQPRLGRPR